MATPDVRPASEHDEQQLSRFLATATREGFRIPCASLQLLYREWCRRERESVLSPGGFEAAMAKLGFKRSPARWGERILDVWEGLQADLDYPGGPNQGGRL